MNAHIITPIVLAVFAFVASAAETNYQSPIDGKTYGADWRTYYPSNSARATNVSSGRVQNQGVRLLSTQDEFNRNVGVSELAEFIRKMEQAIDKSLGTTNESFELAVQTRLTKDNKPSFEMASKGTVAQSVLQNIYDNLGRLPDFRSRKDTLTYEVRFTIAKKL